MNIPFDKIFKTFALFSPIKYRKQLREFGQNLIVKQNIFNLNQNYKQVTKKIKRKIANGEKINVLFVCEEIAKWKDQSIYDLMKQNDHFNASIVVTLPFSKDFRKKEYNANLKYFKSNNIDVLEGYIPSKNEFIPYENFNPDIIFFQQPYASHKNQAVLHCSKFALAYYVPYFIPTHFSFIEYGYPFHSYVKKFYVLDNLIKEQYSKVMMNKAKNLVVVGHPFLDYFYLNKENKQEKKYVIYAPHHSMDDKRTNFATFLWSGKFMLEWAKKHPEINWIFKPHPYLRVTIKNFWPKEEIKNYWDEWAKIGMNYETAGYLDLFQQSYALVTDCGSFLTEYFMTGNPVIHMRRPETIPFNNAVTKITDTYYKAYNQAELENWLEKVLVKREDPLKEKRQEVKKSLDFVDTYSAQNIIDDIKKDFNIND